MRRFVAGFALLIALLLIVEAILSGIGLGSVLSITPWSTNWQLTIPTPIALTASFALGAWATLAVILVARPAPNTTGWVVLASAYLTALLLIAALRGDTPLVRGALLLALGIVLIAVIWRILPNFVPPAGAFPEGALPWAKLGSACVIALLVASAFLGGMILVRAVLATGFAAGALAAAFYTFAQLRAGAPFGSESRFGGLGGGMGGWRLSSTGSFMLLTIILAGTAVALAGADAFKSASAPGNTTARPADKPSLGTAPGTPAEPAGQGNEHPKPPAEKEH